MCIKKLPKRKRKQKKERKNAETMNNRENPACSQRGVFLSKHFLTCFLSNVGKKHFGGFGEKTPEPH